jgi:hypothetical protein
VVALAGRSESKGPPSTDASEGAPDPKCAVQACPLVIRAMCEVLRPRARTHPRVHLTPVDVVRRAASASPHVAAHCASPLPRPCCTSCPGSRGPTLAAGPILSAGAARRHHVVKQASRGAQRCVHYSGGSEDLERQGTSAAIGDQVKSIEYPGILYRGSGISCYIAALHEVHRLVQFAKWSWTQGVTCSVLED